MDFEALRAADVARAFGVSRQSVSGWKSAPRNTDGTYSLPVLISWRMGQLRADLALQFGGDPDLTGTSNSPALERFRLAKARLAETELATKQGRLVEMESLAEAMQLAAAPLKAFHARLGTSHPALACEYEAALDAALAATRKEHHE